MSVERTSPGDAEEIKRNIYSQINVITLMQEDVWQRKTPGAVFLNGKQIFVLKTDWLRRLWRLKNAVATLLRWRRPYAVRKLNWVCLYGGPFYSENLHIFYVVYFLTFSLETLSSWVTLFLQWDRCRWQCSVFVVHSKLLYFLLYCSQRSMQRLESTLAVARPATELRMRSCNTALEFNRSIFNTRLNGIPERGVLGGV